MEGVMAVVTPWAANFAPLGWQFCQGQTISIAENTALFSLIGTTYGGDGQVTFGLPDLQGRIAIGAGQGPGLSNYELGQKAGVQETTITTAQMAMHTHPFVLTTQMPVNADTNSTPNPQGAYPAPGNGNIYSSTAGDQQNFLPLTVTAQIGAMGGNTPVENLQPLLVVNYIICVEGIFPSRN